MITFLLSALVLSSPQSLPIAWGFASSAYQIEGAWNVDGKGISVWDRWFLDGHKILSDTPGQDPAPGDPFITDDHYHRMQEDVKIMKDLGVTIYRFSVSWPRILPNCNGAVNQGGIKFYNSLINALADAGITPVLTLFHWDTPQACHDQYGSWTNDKIVTDFVNYADVIFSNFGDRVTTYLTINEPAAMCGRSYGTVNDQWIWPPGVNGPDSYKYQCVHRVILAHTAVVRMGRTKYASKNFKFGMPLIIEYGIPLTNSAADVKLAKDTTTAQADWLWGPMVTGDYPTYLKTIPSNSATWNYFDGSQLPAFTSSQIQNNKGTLDFLAINYYSSSYRSATGAQGPALPTAGASWQNIYPQGIRPITSLLSQYYNNMEVMVSECGTAVPQEHLMTISQRVNDTFRQSFFEGIVASLSDAVLVDKTPIKSFIAWSLLDNLEWLTFDQVWGLVSIDQEGKTLNRSVKNSAMFLSGYFSNSKSPYTVPKSNPNVPQGSGASNSPSGTNSGITAGMIGLGSFFLSLFL